MYMYFMCMYFIEDCHLFCDMNNTNMGKDNNWTEGVVIA